MYDPFSGNTEWLSLLESGGVHPCGLTLWVLALCPGFFMAVLENRMLAPSL